MRSGGLPGGASRGTRVGSKGLPGGRSRSTRTGSEGLLGSGGIEGEERRLTWMW